MSDETHLRATVDEFETDDEGRSIAVLVSDDGAKLTIPLSLLPAGVELNAVLDLVIRVAEDETDRRKNRIKTLQQRLFKDDN